MWPWMLVRTWQHWPAFSSNDGHIHRGDRGRGEIGGLYLPSQLEATTPQLCLWCVDKLKGGARAPPTCTRLGWLYHHDGTYARKWPLPLFELCEQISPPPPPFTHALCRQVSFPLGPWTSPGEDENTFGTIKYQWILRIFDRQKSTIGKKPTRSFSKNSFLTFGLLMFILLHLCLKKIVWNAFNNDSIWISKDPLPPTNYTIFIVKRHNSQFNVCNH